MKSLFTSLLFLVLHSAVGQVDSLQSYYQQSIKAYESQDYNKFLDYSILLNKIRPNHPTLSYNLAAAYALADQPEAAVQALRRHLGMNASPAYLEDDDFVGLRSLNEFKELSSYMERLNSTIENSTTIIRHSQKEHHFESITYDPTTSTYFFGSVQSRKIFRSKDGEITEFFSNKEIFGVMGLQVDHKRNILWACSAALPEINGYQDSLQNTSTVFAIDLGTNVLLKTYRVKDAILGDIIVDKQGNAIASDSYQNKLYRFSLSEFEILMDLSDVAHNLQGLAIHKNSIYISDYLSGIYHINTRTNELTKINNHGFYSDKGIDGLLYHKGSMIAFQIGTKPRRTITIQLKKNEVAGSTFIDQNLGFEGEATQGVIVDDELVFIGNSAWNAYEKGIYNPELAEDLNVRSVQLINFLIE
ncbi:MAG: hypothetical protein JXR10_01905 [Cyclobacteriaceae bacterium]